MAEEVTRSVTRAFERLVAARQARAYKGSLETSIQRRTRELEVALSELESNYQMTLEALVAALDAREHETFSHSLRVRAYTHYLARRAGFPPALLPSLEQGALLHDIGKIAVTDAILLKPAKLTPEEWVEMRKHPIAGDAAVHGGVRLRLRRQEHHRLARRTNRPRAGENPETESIMITAGIFLLPNGTFFIELIVSIVLILAIYKWVLPPINKAMEERQAKIRDSLDSADRARADAEAADDERRAVLEEARHQAREIVAQANRTAEQARPDAQARGLSEYERIVGNAELEIGLARQRAIEEAAARDGRDRHGGGGAGHRARGERRGAP